MPTELYVIFALAITGKILKKMANSSRSFLADLLVKKSRRVFCACPSLNIKYLNATAKPSKPELLTLSRLNLQVDQTNISTLAEEDGNDEI